ncbi:uncharacterized protein LOC142171546 [Nicotiana tabacum]|uniref:Uncharacterized protein LOC142171546 n=4 Tax=Nicotiana tabacum TaxID=4097 RepID=A0AC58SZK7_TOBAC
MKTSSTWNKIKRDFIERICKVYFVCKVNPSRVFVDIRFFKVLAWEAETMLKLEYMTLTKIERWTTPKLSRSRTFISWWKNSDKCLRQHISHGEKCYHGSLYTYWCNTKCSSCTEYFICTNHM